MNRSLLPIIFQLCLLPFFTQAESPRDLIVQKMKKIPPKASLEENKALVQELHDQGLTIQEAIVLITEKRVVNALLLLKQCNYLSDEEKEQMIDLHSSLHKNIDQKKLLVIHFSPETHFTEQDKKAIKDLFSAEYTIKEKIADEYTTLSMYFQEYKNIDWSQESGTCCRARFKDTATLITKKPSVFDLYLGLNYKNLSKSSQSAELQHEKFHMNANHRLFLYNVKKLCMRNKEAVPIQFYSIKQAIESEADLIPASKDLATAVAFVKYAKEIKALTKNQTHTLSQDTPEERLEWFKKIRNLLQAQEEIDAQSELST